MDGTNDLGSGLGGVRPADLGRSGGQSGVLSAEPLLRRVRGVSLIVRPSRNRAAAVQHHRCIGSGDRTAPLSERTLWPGGTTEDPAVRASTTVQLVRSYPDGIDLRVDCVRPVP